MSSKRFVEKKQQKKIAQDRICYLFRLAEKTAQNNNLAFANRYVQLARKISMRYRVSIPKEYKRQFCKHCYAYIVPGETARIRIHQGRIITFCTRCNNYTRFILPKKPREKRKNTLNL